MYAGVVREWGKWEVGGGMGNCEEDVAKHLCDLQVEAWVGNTRIGYRFPFEVSK